MHLTSESSVGGTGPERFAGRFPVSISLAFEVGDRASGVVCATASASTAYMVRAIEIILEILYEYRKRVGSWKSARGLRGFGDGTQTTADPRRYSHA
jgi:hypothetical protein